MRIALAVAMAPTSALILAGCVAPIHTAVRDPGTGQIEVTTMSVMFMSMKLRCTDGTSAEGKMMEGKSSVVARDHLGNARTCGRDFSGAVCWPSANASVPPAPATTTTSSPRPAPDWRKADNLLWLGDRCVERK